VVGLNFSIKKIIPEPFSGENRMLYRAWRLKWDDASERMTKLGFTPAQQLCELKLATKGEARGWIENLREDDENLQGALDILEKTYLNITRDAAEVLKAFLYADQMKENSASIKQGLKLLTTAQQTLKGMKLTSDEIVALFFIVGAEHLMYPKFKVAWQDVKNKTKDPTKAIGYSATVEDCIDLFYDRIEKSEDYESSKEIQRREADRNNQRKHRENPTIPGGFAGLRKDDSRPPKSGGEGSKKHCVGCKKDGHYLLQCFDFTKKLTSGRDRRNFLNKQEIKICRNCLKFDHKTEKCESKNTCNCGVGGHHKLLHEDRGPRTSKPATKEEQDQEERMSYPIRALGNGKPILQSCLANVLGENGEKTLARIFLDPGSEITLIRRGFAQELGLQGKEVTLQMAVAGGGVTNQSKEMEVTFQLQSLDKQYITPKIVATTAKTITRDLRPVDIATDQYDHLKKIKFTEHFPRREVKVDILMGCDYYANLITGEVIRGKPSEPVALATKLGYVLTGSA